MSLRWFVSVGVSPAIHGYKAWLVGMETVEETVRLVEMDSAVSKVNGWVVSSQPRQAEHSVVVVNVGDVV